MSDCMTDPNVLSIWTVYDHPIDMPEYYVARRFEVKPGGEYGPTHDYIRDTDVERIREAMRDKWLERMPRWEGDDPKIVESWI